VITPRPRPAGEPTRFAATGGLPGLLAELVRHDPGAVVAVDSGPGARRHAVTRERLWLRTRELAADLARRGVRPGDRVAVCLPNWSEALAWQFAVAAMGAVLVGVNTRYTVEEIAHLLTRARPKAVAVARDFHGLDLPERLRAAITRAGPPDPLVVPVAGPGDQAGADGLETSRAGRGGEYRNLPESPDGDPDRLAVAFTTSGSTGLPKLAAHSGRGVLVHARADAGAMGISEGDHMLCVLPLAGVFGFNAALAALAAGGVCVLHPVFDADAALDDMAGYRVTHLASGDDLGLRLAEAYRARPRDLGAWRWWGIADFQGRGRELAGWAERTFGTSVTGLYGSSEVFALTAMWPAEEPPERRWDGGGRLVHDDIEVRVVDPGSGAVLAPGQEGELQFRGPNVVDGYLGGGADPFTEDGWFRSGDLGALVDERAFRYVCRMGDALRLRGFLVDPAEIELRLAAYPGVHTAKVVGVPGADGATRAVGFVVPCPDARLDAAGLRSWCAEGLAAFKVPAAIRVVEEMPTTSGTNGTKVRAAVLRDWASDALAAGDPPTPGSPAG
jgi:fatty-acyl-CoA synthase